MRFDIKCRTSCVCWEYRPQVLRTFIDHPRSGIVYNFEAVCLTNCLSVCLSDNCRKPWPRKFIFAHPVQLRRIRVKFVYECHWVSGAKKVKNLYSRKVKLLSTTQSSEVSVHHGVFDYGWSNGVTAVFVTWPEVTPRN